MILTTTPQIEGRQILEYKGVVTGETIITITDMESVRSMVWALFSLFPAAIVVIMIGLLYLYPIKK